MSSKVRVVLTLLSVFVFCLALPRRAAAQRCEHEAQRSASSAAAGIERVEIHAHAGSLEVTGRPGATQISARGRACASDADDLPELALRIRRSGSTLVIEATQPDARVRIGNHYAYLDAVVELPENVAVTIEDGSGDMRVTRVGALEIEDGSGDIEVADVGGRVAIDDGSGDIDVSNVRGEVDIEDGSGDVRIRQVGAVRIEDGSGDVRIDDVTRDVHVDEDGSGSIYVQRVGGDLTVDDDGSGDVRYSAVSGRVSVPDDD